MENVVFAIDQGHIVPQMAMECRPGVGGLNQVYGPNCPTQAQSICGKYNFFPRCTNRNQFDILMTTVADVIKGQTDMAYKGEQQTLTKQSMRHLICPCETWKLKHLSNYKCLSQYK